MVGGISFTNHGPKACVLRGYVRVQLYGDAGQSLPVVIMDVAGDPTNGINYGTPIDPSPPGVSLAPGVSGTAYSPTQWFNWCGPPPGTIGLRVTLPDGERLTSQPGTDYGPTNVPPRCDSGLGSTSTLYIAPVGQGP
jgi:hypothetical protein